MRIVFVALLSVASFAAETVAVSPVDARIQAARREVAANPKSAQGQGELVFALLRKARDTGDVALYDEANTAIARMAAGFEAEKFRARVMLGKRQYAEALKAASAINKKVPDDIEVWALLADINSAMGKYDEAERCAQWVLDLRRGSALGFEEASELRETFGDLEGAVEFIDETLRRTSPADADQRAWLLMRRAYIAVLQGNTKAAETSVSEARGLFPDSQRLLATQAEIQIAEGKLADAASLFEKRYKKVSTAANLYDWAEALKRAGQIEEAQKQFALFETKAKAEMPLANLQLIAYYDDQKISPSDALMLATKEAAVRQDCATLDALAWSMYRSGRLADAKVQMDRVLAVGAKDPEYLAHSAIINAKTGASQ